MYAVVAPGLQGVYTNWKDVERISALHPYAKWCKCYTEEDAQKFIKRNINHHTVKQLYNYGDTFNNMYIDAKYRIRDSCLYIVLNTSRVGNLRIPDDNCIVAYSGSNVYIRVPEMYLSDKTIDSHMSAILCLLNIVGEFVDINIELPNFSVFYALTKYSRDSVRTIKTVQSTIKSRLCRVSFTLEMRR